MTADRLRLARHFRSTGGGRPLGPAFKATPVKPARRRQMTQRPGLPQARHARIIMKSNPRELPPGRRAELLGTLKDRFGRNLNRHGGLDWATVQVRLEAQPDRLWSLGEMERTGGEPDVVGHDKKSGAIVFMDCSPESPAGRRSVCYDREGWLSRKDARPRTTAVDLAMEMGVAPLTEAEYVALQKLGEFDLKTSSWIATPAEIRERGGALYAERRYGRVFIGHNGAQSYYAVRGFRGVLRA